MCFRVSRLQLGRNEVLVRQEIRGCVCQRALGYTDIPFTLEVSRDLYLAAAFW